MMLDLTRAGPIAIRVGPAIRVNAAEIPASRLLQQISADSGHSADLRSGGVTSRFRQRGITGSNFRIISYAGQCRQRADLQLTRFADYDSIESWNRQEIHQPGWRQDAFLHQIEDIHAAGFSQDQAFKIPIGEQLRGLLNRGGIHPFKCWHLRGLLRTVWLPGRWWASSAA